MSERDDIDLLKDIREAIIRIKNYCDGMGYEDFLSDIKTQDAAIRNLEIIGEAAKAISTKLRKKYPDMPWKGMAGIRDRLIHHYFGVNLDIVWNVINDELPALEPQIDEMLRQKKGDA